MPPKSSDDEQKLTRRLFLQHSASATAVSATLYSVAMKTDAIAQAPQLGLKKFGPGEAMPYPYLGP